MKQPALTKVKLITFTALLGALSAVLMILRFPIPFMPPFMEMDFAPVTEIMGGFLFGPLCAFLTILVKTLVKLVIQGSQTFGTGDLSALILSLVYVMPASFFYKYHKNKKAAGLVLIVDTILVTIAAVVSNVYFIFPFYAKMMGAEMADLIAMCTAVNPYVTDTLTLVFLTIIPFNIIKYGLCSIVTRLLYKSLSRAVKNIVYH